MCVCLCARACVCVRARALSRLAARVPSPTPCRRSDLLPKWLHNSPQRCRLRTSAGSTLELIKKKKRKKKKKPGDSPFHGYLGAWGSCEAAATQARLSQLMQKKEKSFGIQMLSVQPDTKPKGCAGCNRKIKDRYLLKALDKYWHEDCLKCACCDCRLGEVGSTLYTKANLILCRRDYLRLFGVTGNCAACSKLIPAFEMVMRAKDNVYHLDCFACQLCNQRFCVGDKFFLKNNMILCQTDYEEGLMKEGYAPQVR
ncbi:LIM domain only protein 3 isoform X1 [Sorex araneus]|uniref:LIM domain only protein 3 isoform X1 n=1 Tax=Sorex araneus TaxID=42254 RepID=UPI00243389F6|nr:LIM domain only protein 3 isoform X1 [Sorex araneus]